MQQGYAPLNLYVTKENVSEIFRYASMHLETQTTLQFVNNRLFLFFYLWCMDGGP